MSAKTYYQTGSNEGDGLFEVNGEELAVTSWNLSTSINLEKKKGVYCRIIAETGLADNTLTINMDLVSTKLSQTLSYFKDKKEQFNVVWTDYETNITTVLQGCLISGGSIDFGEGSKSASLTIIFDEII